MNIISTESHDTALTKLLPSDLSSDRIQRNQCKTVLYLDHTAKLGGGEIALLDLICALDPARYRAVVVLASDGPLADRLRAAGIDTRIVPLDAAVLNTRKDSLSGSSFLHLRSIWACLCYALTLARIARAVRADLIHTNSLKSDLYGGLAGRLAGIPVLWHVRDRIDAQYLPPQVASLFRRLSRVLPHAIIANSESTLKTLRPRCRQPAAAVYSGVTELPPLTARRPSAPPTISLVGRLASWKGQHIFIQAAALVLAEFPNTRFQIIGAPLFGEDAYAQTLHQTVADLGLTQKILFLGFRDDVPALLADTDIVAHASTLGEPFGQVVVQGMAVGKPVVATDGGSLREIVVPGETGLLVPMGDAAAMAQAFRELLVNPALARKMGEAGRRRVRERFTMTQTIHALEGIYSRLLGISPT